MKLILKQYLASLKERNELDAILPSLLSQMGLNVFISPTRGVKEYGVDIAAVGHIDSDIEKVYLFSVKSGNLTRSTWNGNTDQALRPSLDEILDSFIPTRLQPEHKGKPIVICLCFGGDINTAIRQEVTGYTKKNSDEIISFQEWNGDRLADLIMRNMLKEELLFDGWQSMLRKSLALLSEPEISHKHFKNLVDAIFGEIERDEQVADKLNQVNLCLWVLFSWCRDESNLESSYLSAEYSLLNSWSIANDAMENKHVKSAFLSLLGTYHLISDNFIEKSLLPYVGMKHAVSHGIASSCSIDLNLKLFDLLGRLTLKGQWLLSQLMRSHTVHSPFQGENQDQLKLRRQLESITKSIKLLVINNPLLLSPYKDSQAIDLAMAFHLLSQNSDHDDFVISWLDEIIDRSSFSYVTNGMYPGNLDTYERLLEHKNKDKQDTHYKKKTSRGSVLYPMLAVLCGIHKAAVQSKKLNDFSNEYLQDCTLQYVSPNSISEENIYSNKNLHGTAVANFPLAIKGALKFASQEIESSNDYWKLSAVEQNYSPLVFVACRYHRQPIPLHLFSDLIDEALRSDDLETN